MTKVGSGKYSYEMIEHWGNLPPGGTFGRVVSVAVDSQDRLYAFQAQTKPIKELAMIVFDREGNYLSSWGSGVFLEPHGIHIDSDDLMYLTDKADHVVSKYTLEGSLIMELGNRGQPSDTGCTEDGGVVPRPAGPFNMPSDMFLAPSGEIYVSDGYRNSRIHRFSASGGLISSWGKYGMGAPGAFCIPHCTWVDSAGIVYVVDRQNSRIQVFSATGDFIDQWTDLDHPTAMYMDAEETVYISEGAPAAGDPSPAIPRIGVWDRQGNLLERFDSPSRPHWICGDSRGDLYVAETLAHTITKYVKQR